MGISDKTARYLLLFVTDSERTRKKEAAVKNWEDYRNQFGGSITINSLQVLEQLEKEKDQIGIEWRNLSDEMFDLETEIKKWMEANQMTTIKTSFNGQAVNLNLLPDFKLEVRNA